MKKIEHWFKQVSEAIKQPRNGSTVPVVSGAAALWLISKTISSNLSDWRFAASLFCAIIVFIASAILFAYLKKIEKDKDQYLLSTVGKIVEDIFKHYGVAMASNAAGPTTANQMNPIMQTIVNLVKGLKQLADKTYTKS
jgi:hypothetical protein